MLRNTADMSDEFNSPDELGDWQAPARLHRRNTTDLLSRLPAFRSNPAPDGSPWGPELYDPLNDKNHPFKDESEYQRAIKPFYKRRNPVDELEHELEHDLDDDVTPMSMSSNEDLMDAPMPMYKRNHMRRRNPMPMSRPMFDDDMGMDSMRMDSMPPMPFRGRHFNRRNPYMRDMFDPVFSRNRSNPYMRGPFDPVFSRQNPVGRGAMPWGNRSNPYMRGPFDPVFARQNPVRRGAMPWRGRSNPRSMFDPLFARHNPVRRGAMPWRANANRSNPYMRGPFDPVFSRQNPARRAATPWRGRNNPQSMFDPLFKRNLRRRANPFRNPDEGVGLYRSIFSNRNYR